MSFQKPYKIEVDGNEVFLINSSTGEKEYKIDPAALRDESFPAVAINRADKIRIPISRIDKEGMNLLMKCYPEYFL